jgi:hypothetical protein
MNGCKTGLTLYSDCVIVLDRVHDRNQTLCQAY